MNDERDLYGNLIDPVERKHEALLGLHDVLWELEEAGFTIELISELSNVREKFINEFERQHPEPRDSRALWR